MFRNRHSIGLVAKHIDTQQHTLALDIKQSRYNHSRGRLHPLAGPPIVHCARVSLTSTIVAPFWAHWSLVGDWFVQLHSLCDIIRGNGAPLMLFVMGPHPSNVARGISLFYLWLCNIFFWGFLSPLLSLPKVLGSAALFGRGATMLPTQDAWERDKRIQILNKIETAS